MKVKIKKIIPGHSEHGIIVGDICTAYETPGTSRSPYQIQVWGNHGKMILLHPNEYEILEESEKKK